MTGLKQSRRYFWVIAISAGLLLGLFASSAFGAVAVDKTVTTHQSAAAKTIVSPALTTSAPSELLLAFITSDGPSGAGSMSFSGVTGGGLTWHLVRRANAQAGTAEIWAAGAPAVLTNATVTATRATGSYAGSITVVALSGADLTAAVASAGASAATGAPSVTVTTTRAGSWVWGVGNDWDRATARTVGSGQTKVDEYLAPVGDTLWVQRQNAAAPLPGTAVTLNDTAPTTDRWNLAAVEVLPAVTDTQSPSAPTGLTAGTVTSSKVPLSWTASTDDQGVAGYRVFRGATQVGEVAGTSFTDTTVAASTTYTYTVKAFDGAGNVSEPSNPVTVTTPAPSDTTPPTVSMTAPGEGATVTGTTKLTATASDASGIAGVQFLLDGSPLGAEDTSSPYELSWNSTGATNAQHTLSARAPDGEIKPGNGDDRVDLTGPDVRATSSVIAWRRGTSLKSTEKRRKISNKSTEVLCRLFLIFSNSLRACRQQTGRLSRRNGLLRPFICASKTWRSSLTSIAPRYRRHPRT